MQQKTKKSLTNYERNEIMKGGLPALRRTALNKVNRRFCSEEKVPYQMIEEDIKENIFEYLSKETGITLDSGKETKRLMDYLNNYTTSDLIKEMNQEEKIAREEQAKALKELENQNKEMRIDENLANEIVIIIDKLSKVTDFEKDKQAIEWVTLLESKLQNATTGTLRIIPGLALKRFGIKDENGKIKYPSGCKGSNYFNFLRCILGMKPGYTPQKFNKEEAINFIYGTLYIVGYQPDLGKLFESETPIESSNDPRWKILEDSSEYFKAVIQARRKINAN